MVLYSLQVSYANAILLPVALGSDWLPARLGSARIADAGSRRTGGAHATMSYLVGVCIEAV
jgi:hypothetical protein